jgi:hypothetical protein
MFKAENVCRFRGRLTEYSTKLVGNDGYLLGKGKLFLPDSEAKSIGQTINLSAWGDVAERLQQVELGSWINVFTTYTPNTFNGRIYEDFTVGGFKCLQD